MSFVPMYLSSMNCAIYEADPSDPLKFSPPAPTIASAQSGKLTNASANRNRLSVSNGADEFEIHRPRIESPFHQKFQPLSNQSGSGAQRTAQAVAARNR